jgi:cell division protein FtsB
MVERAPRAEALAASWMTKFHPVFARIHALRRRIATIAVAGLAGLLFVHVMLGANGMVVYKQKRAEYELLQKRIALEQKENQLYSLRIQGMKTDTKAIEKEAREQLHYARPGEYVYVPPDPVRPDPPVNHSARR